MLCLHALCVVGTGGGMDTSIKVFAARKKLKKQNKRLGGDRTSHT